MPVVAAAEVRLRVAGDVREQGGQLRVRVDLTNDGDVAARGMQVEGELFEARSEATLTAPLAPGQTASVELSFAAAAPRPGVHGLALHLQYWPEVAAPSAPSISQRAYLLLALGQNAAAPVHVSVPDAQVTRYTEVPVRLTSADGAAHRVRLRALAPRGVNALPPDEPVAVPASGAAEAPLRVLRAGAPAGSQAGLVVMASEVDGPVERTAVGTGRVDIGAPAPWLPRMRAGLLGAALVLMAAAVAVELRGWLRRA
jgi:hypothetical protein